MLGAEFWVMGLLRLLLVPAQEKRKPTSTQTLVHNIHSITHNSLKVDTTHMSITQRVGK